VIDVGTRRRGIRPPELEPQLWYPAGYVYAVNRSPGKRQLDFVQLG
jgi:hypothetical protein